MNIKIPRKFIKLSFIFLLILVILLIISKFVEIPATEKLFELHHTGLNLWAIFLTGLLTGGLTCLAVQGGLLATTITQRQEEKMKEDLSRQNTILPIASFLTSKFIAYTILGLLLGLFGSVFKPSLFAMGILQIVVSVFLIGTALNMLNVHPVFRYFVLQPPHFLTRMIRKKAKSKDVFAPVLLGGLTIFIPCGTTQAMMALAISSADPLSGMLIMSVFTLGTSPLFFVLGYFTTKLSQAMHGYFMRFAAIVIFALSLFMINNALMMIESPFAPSKLFARQTTTMSKVTVRENAVIEINSRGYSPQKLTVKAGEEVSLKLKNTDGYGCQQAFYIPQLEVNKVVRPGNEEIISFVAPEKKGKITFMCSMGMYWGVIEVI